jgi:hypothetical protein
MWLSLCAATICLSEEPKYRAGSVQKSSASRAFNIILIGLFQTPEERRNSTSACSGPARSRVVGNLEVGRLPSRVPASYVRAPKSAGILLVKMDLYSVLIRWCLVSAYGR